MSREEARAGVAFAILKGWLRSEPASNGSPLLAVGDAWWGQFAKDGKGETEQSFSENLDTFVRAMDDAGADPDRWQNLRLKNLATEGRWPTLLGKKSDDG